MCEVQEQSWTLFTALRPPEERPRVREHNSKCMGGEVKAKAKGESPHGSLREQQTNKRTNEQEQPTTGESKVYEGGVRVRVCVDH
jgi:hypothetical protein